MNAKVHVKRKVLLLFMEFVLLSASAQISKQQADNIVVNTIMNDTTKVAYGMSAPISSNQTITTADGVVFCNPFKNAYVYYIDDMPSANWAHQCRYCFVNASNGAYFIEYARFYPDNYAEFIKIGANAGGANTQWPYTNYVVPQKANPNGKLYAVLIGGDSGIHHPVKIWYDLSCVYTALVNHYGFKEKTATEPNHIIVTAHDNVMSYLDNNDVTTDLYDLNQSRGTYDSKDFFEDIEYSKNGQ